MNKPVIAVDIDDVLTDHVSSFVEYSNQKWGTNLARHDYSEDMFSIWGVGVDEYHRRWDEYLHSGILAHYEVLPGAKETLARLKNDHDLVVVTARSSGVVQYTHDWLDKHFSGVFSDVHFAGIWDSKDHPATMAVKTKAGLAQKIGVSYLIDDQPKHCLAAHEVGIKAVLFGDYPWQQTEELPDGVLVAPSWSHVEGIIVRGHERV